MITVSSTQMQQNFGQYFDKARNEPIAISKSGNVTAVMISVEEYEKLERLDDWYWSMLAKEAQDDGNYIDAEEFFKQRLMEIDNEA